MLDFVVLLSGGGATQGAVDPLAPGALLGFEWTSASSDNTPNFNVTFRTSGGAPLEHEAGMFLHIESSPGVDYVAAYEIQAADLIAGTIDATASAIADGTYASFLARVEDATQTHFGPWLTVTDGPIIIDTTGPVISTNGTQTVDENATLAITLAANESATWAIRAVGDDAASVDHDEFEISGTTLRWSSNGTRDYESPADDDTDNAYVVVVRATDALGNTTDKTITVTVQDVAEGGAGDAILLETGDHMLLESGDLILLEA